MAVTEEHKPGALHVFIEAWFPGYTVSIHLFLSVDFWIGAQLVRCGCSANRLKEARSAVENFI